MKKRIREMFGKNVDIEELVYQEEKTRQQNFREKIKVETNSGFDKKLENYSKEREAQEAEQKRKLEYWKTITKLEQDEREI